MKIQTQPLIQNVQAEHPNKVAIEGIPKNNTSSGNTTSSIEDLSKQYNFRSMTADERHEFANKAVSTGAITLKEAGGILPLPGLQRIETEHGYSIESHKRSGAERFDLIRELENSISYSKQHGGSKGIEIRESLLLKLQHLDRGTSFSEKA